MNFLLVQALDFVFVFCGLPERLSKTVGDLQRLYKAGKFNTALYFNLEHPEWQKAHIYG